MAPSHSTVAHRPARCLPRCRRRRVEASKLPLRNGMQPMQQQQMGGRQGMAGGKPPPHGGKGPAQLRAQPPSWAGANWNPRSGAPSSSGSGQQGARKAGRMPARQGGASARCTRQWLHCMSQHWAITQLLCTPGPHAPSLAVPARRHGRVPAPPDARGQGWPLQRRCIHHQRQLPSPGQQRVQPAQRRLVQRPVFKHVRLHRGPVTRLYRAIKGGPGHVLQ